MIWYEEEVKRAEQEKNKLDYEPRMIFYGGSSIKLWDQLYEDFKAYYPINLGFGGSTLAACDWFFDRLLQNYNPLHIVFYAGDNDLGDGRSPEEVFIFFEQFVTSLDKLYHGASFSFISVKPSLARWDIIDRIRVTNKFIKDYIEKTTRNYFYVNVFDAMLNAEGLPIADLFEPDGLHLSKKGYALWKEILLTHFSANLKDSVTLR